jgi:hypothetical protein
VLIFYTQIECQQHRGWKIIKKKEFAWKRTEFAF